MPRANRYFLHGNIWHITHRCHKKDFLLSLRRDRIRWLHWLYEAKKRYGGSILNYMVTCNHIHLLIMDNSVEGSISKLMQLVQSRTAQEYNIRKHRKGAFWEDRYHATAIDSEDYLIRCMTYINMNMVRAGVVKHPSEWSESGYSEIAFPKKRYRLIDVSALMKELHLNSLEELQINLNDYIKEAIDNKLFERQSKWTESIAVGSEEFVENIKAQLDIKAKSRKIMQYENDYILSESEIPYNIIFDPKNGPLRPK